MLVVDIVVMYVKNGLLRYYCTLMDLFIAVIFFSSFLFNNNPHCLFLNPTFQLPYLEKHKLTHEPNAKQKHGNATKTVCNLCHKKFSNNMALRGHMKKHKEKTANFRCPVCKKRFQAAEVMDTRLSIRMSMTSALHKLMMI